MENKIHAIQTDFICDFLAGDAQKVGRYGFPQLAQENYIPDAKVLPFNYMLNTDYRHYWYHCFVGDEQFRRLYYNFWGYCDTLKQLRGLISTDFSMFRNVSEETLVENCRRNRSLHYALQKESVKAIPTAGFAGEASWEWCFDGLPSHSTVAVTTNCLGKDPEAHRLFIGGVDAMVNKIHPTAIVVCGKCPEWLFSKYPSVKIVPIPSYSQMWQKRKRCA